MLKESVVYKMWYFVILSLKETKRQIFWCIWFSTCSPLSLHCKTMFPTYCRMENMFTLLNTIYVNSSWFYSCAVLILYSFASTCSPLSPLSPSLHYKTMFATYSRMKNLFPLLNTIYVNSTWFYTCVVLILCKF